MGSEAKFRVGDKVRFTHKCNAGWWFGPNTKYTTGVIRRGGSNDWSVECSNGGTAYVTHDNQMELVHAPLTIEAGKFYMTREGRRVGPMEKFVKGGGALSKDVQGRQAAFVARDLEDCQEGGAYTADGEYLTGGPGYGLHLIAEAPTPTYTANAAAEVDNLADEYGGGKQRFKVGDRVRCLRNDGAPPYFTVGKAYTVVEVVDTRSHESGQLVRCIPNIPNAYHCTSPVGQYGDAWELLPSYSHAIVALIESGQPKPSHLPYVHNTRASAETEANRLAGKHKGKEFGVYELLSTIKEEPVYEHEWQRLAASGDIKEAARKLKDASGIPLISAKQSVDYWLYVAA